ncbi:MAG: hypothetical protein AAGI44_00930 [Pseudomonadota bacterium]
MNTNTEDVRIQRQTEILKAELKQATNRTYWLGIAVGTMLGVALGMAIGYDLGANHIMEIVPKHSGIEV